MRDKTGGWGMVEVKSGTNHKAEHIDDMAYTTMVMKQAGTEPVANCLMLVSRDYRLGMDNSSLFKASDHTKEVKERVERFEGLLTLVEEGTRGEMPKPKSIIYKCRGCLAKENCWGDQIEGHILELPRIGQTKFEELIELGVNKILEIPEDYPISDYQERIRETMATGQSYVGDGLKEELDSIELPTYYLDFETINTAIPIYEDVAPYTQIPTQYSIHVWNGPGSELEHKDYLADHEKDPRREVAEKLLSDIGRYGSIVVYSNFEKNILNALRKLNPDLDREIRALIKRLVDLEAIIKGNYYNSDFQGRTSIKKTLPALVPEMSYEDLEIRDGTTAMATFAYIAMGKISGSEADEEKEKLREYCKRDTRAMVELHGRLMDISNEKMV